MIESDVIQLRVRVAKLERTVEFLMKHVGADYVEDAPGAVPADVVALVRKGDKIGAIKLYREYTGLGLKEAMAVVDTIG